MTHSELVMWQYYLGAALAAARQESGSGMTQRFDLEASRSMIDLLSFKPRAGNAYLARAV